MNKTVVSVSFALLLSTVHIVICQDSEWGTNDYIEYQVGTTGTKIILTSSHGGHLRPESIPERDHGCFIADVCVYSHFCSPKDELNCRAVVIPDAHTLELTGTIADAMQNITGQRPHVILNHLHRGKLDANREIEQAAFGVPEAETAWREFHEFIERAQATVGTGLLVDIHGHGHPEPWLEIGYLFSGLDLDLNDIDPARSSIYHLSTQVNVPFDDLLRGAESLGGRCEAAGYIAVPAPDYPGPDGGNYFTGGYITRRHGSRDQGTIDAIQIESPRFLRDMWEDYGSDLAVIILNFYQRWYT
ncbi:unnamed protein product [Owenia fusiformis]|uniref:Uncharacterized protein n=1 Tax=Owenia fusiformis TaxID=6347 RepID=A0A8J1XI79_OWEFU|nr:unnamed protein product [Owenia fusiformis]